MYINIRLRKVITTKVSSSEFREHDEFSENKNDQLGGKKVEQNFPAKSKIVNFDQ